MIFSIDGNEFVVKFHTEKVDSGNKTESGKTILTPVATQCTITKNAEFLGTGYAKCHPNDNFDAEIGRQIALKNATTDASLTKPERKILWEFYRVWGKTRF